MITIRTLLCYLVGDRQAILDLASSRSALWLGAMLVLSAGVAREYDGESLVHEPWHLLIPFGASLVSSFVLFCLIMACLGMRRLQAVREVRFGSAYRSFLTLYWMTAPLAWVYAIPVERMLSPAAATSANLWFLALVSAWRVLLMIRGVSVLFRTGGLAATMIVMLFADAVVLVLLFSTPLPVISFMGGVRLSESEQVLQATKLLVGLAGFLTLPVWFLGTCLSVWLAKGDWQPVVSGDSPRGNVSRTAWLVGWASLAVWAAVLPFTQAEQQRRWRVERDLRGGRISEALQFLSAREPGDFPPHWDPPPRIAYGDAGPPLLDVLEAVMEGSPRAWVRQVYLDKLSAQLHGGSHWFWYEQSEESQERLLSLLERLPEGREIIAEQRGQWQDVATPRESDSEREAAIRERLRRLLPAVESDASR
ncbi:MAG TPA: hypothetical protein VML55_05800 [Planctomycetaceae bacterium]|nr:hypothetical protein [Planctomycetaceae bacterium]